MADIPPGCTPPQSSTDAAWLLDPAWHLFDIDPASSQGAWLELSENVFRDASFLDQRVAGLATAQRRAEIDPAYKEITAADSQPPHFIFHLGHCGSTLLSRALASTPAVLPLREPLTLRRLATLDSGSDPAPGSAL